MCIRDRLHTAHHLAIGNQYGAGIGRMLADIDRLITTYLFDWQQVWHEAQRWGLEHEMCIRDRVSEARGQQEVLISDIDRLAMVVRYELSSPPANDDDFELPSPE